MVSVNQWGPTSEHLCWPTLDRSPDYLLDGGGAVKYICIDSNIFRHLFSRSKDFSDEIESLLVRLIDNKEVGLLLPLQIKQEVERNRVGDWYKGEAGVCDSKIANKEDEIAALKKKYSAYGELEPLVARLKSEEQPILKQKDEVREKYFSSQSPENMLLQEVLRRAKNITETREIQVLAWLREEKRNPPRDSEEHYGDAIIWESLLSYFRENCGQGADSLILVSNDSKAWGDGALNPWLKDEWMAVTACSICLVNTMADVDQLTKEEQDNKEEQDKIRKTELEELKHNALIDFVGSDSFLDAGTNARNLLSFKDSLDSYDLEQVLKASTTNFQITQSFFTRDPLLTLVHGQGDMAVDAAEAIDDELWNRFCERYQIRLWRRKDVPFQ